jgi:hypothetical protein
MKRSSQTKKLWNLWRIRQFTLDTLERRLYQLRSNNKIRTLDMQLSKYTALALTTSHNIERDTGHTAPVKCALRRTC